MASFGSVGDIIAICQIVGTLVKALNDSRGSASELVPPLLPIETPSNGTDTRALPARSRH